MEFIRDYIDEIDQAKGLRLISLPWFADGLYLSSIAAFVNNKLINKINKIWTDAQ